jgi:RNA polymerase sigma factor (sigma-70 family)
MDELELANRFDRERPRLRSVAYRIVGSLSEADDAMQEAWLRLQRTQAGEIDNLEGWLRTVVVRISLNVLRTRRSRAEEPLDAFVPEPVISSGARDDPEQTALLADDVGIALQVVLEALTPAERVAFVLHDMFAVPFDEIAALVERSPEATRQLASRARRRSAAPRRRRTPTWLVSGRSSRPTSLPPARATSTLSSRCSIPTSWRGPMGEPGCASCAAPRRSPARR